MWRHWPILLLLSLAGCGAGRFEELGRELTEVNEELAAAWAGVTDAGTMKAAEPKLIELYRRQVRLEREAKKLGKPADAVNDGLAEKYGPRLQSAVNKILQEQQRIHDRVPGGVEFLQKIKDGIKKPRAGGSDAAGPAPRNPP